MSELPPANWYPDPEVPGQQRYWDGTQWTEHRAPGAGAQPGQQYGQDPQAGSQQQQPAQAPWTQAGQGQVAYTSTASSSTNGLAITSLVVAVVSFFLSFVAVGGLLGIVAIVLGVIALRKIRDTVPPQGGRGLAISGIVVGAISVLIGIFVFVVFAFVGTVVEQGTSDVTDFFECIEEEARTGEDLNC